MHIKKWVSQDKASTICIRRISNPLREIRRQAELKRMANGRKHLKPMYEQVNHGWRYIGHRNVSTRIYE